ncbi:hypothetical protein N3K66_002556 [Trichothecium roseum]|uniref:Uncharacterized protein n=1 Tax=Trichothecium roseum TaxID=47278 RepID=A0ACC0V9Y2_9HYPO|nr:hypothetical protein N3K66_002556 [Trichothecium roseum]
MRPTLLRRLADAGKEASRDLPPLLANNPYQARKVWPPDFTRLSPQQQLRFEKKYKRRLYLSHYNPRWDKGVKMLQLGTIAALMGWLLFYAEFEWWGERYKPYEEIVQKAVNLFGVMDPEKRYERRKDAPRLPSDDDSNP